jgi:hypothetical protein
MRYLLALTAMFCTALAAPLKDTAQMLAERQSGPILGDLDSVVTDLGVSIHP